MPRTRIKICGVMTPADAVLAAEAGADAVGFILHAPGRKRMVAPDVARDITLALPPWTVAVGVVVDPPAFAMTQLLRQVPVDILQFHGRESPGVVTSFGRRATKVLTDPADLQLWANVDGVSGLTLDSPVGGSGVALDWLSLVETFRSFTAKPLTLAGGLTPETVADAVRLLRPHAVDVSSGVESAPGLKDAAQMKTFVAAVRAADAP